MFGGIKATFLTDYVSFHTLFGFSSQILALGLCCSSWRVPLLII